jgi:hypothetical protein
MGADNVSHGGAEMIAAIVVQSWWRTMLAVNEHRVHVNSTSSVDENNNSNRNQEVSPPLLSSLLSFPRPLSTRATTEQQKQQQKLSRHRH